MSTKKKIKKIIIFALIAVFVILMINVLQIPKLIKYEIQTSKYGHEFLDPTIYHVPVDVADVTRVKVLQYGKYKAKVYCICGDWEFGYTVDFVRENGGQWRLKHEKKQWSTIGPAKSIVMPYWWHIIYRYANYRY